MDISPLVSSKGRLSHIFLYKRCSAPVPYPNHAWFILEEIVVKNGITDVNSKVFLFLTFDKIV